VLCLGVIEWWHLLFRCRFLLLDNNAGARAKDLNHHNKPAMPPCSREVRMGKWTQFQVAQNRHKLQQHLCISYCASCDLCTKNYIFFRVSPEVYWWYQSLSSNHFNRLCSTFLPHHAIRIKKTIVRASIKRAHNLEYPRVLPSTEKDFNGKTPQFRG